MERELLTRTFMIGWVALGSFLAAWAPGNWRSALESMNNLFGQYPNLDNGTILSVAGAVLGSPLIGYMISSLVLFYMYLRFGDPYNFYSRRQTETLVEKEYPPLRTNGGSLCWGVDLFTYLAYSRENADMPEWGRRRHTTRFLGYNWMVATALGLLAGALARNGYPVLWALLGFGVALVLAGLFERCIHWNRVEQDARNPKDEWPKVWAARYQPWSLFTISLAIMAYSAYLSGMRPLPTIAMSAIISLLIWFLAFRASCEVEAFERLWVKDYLPTKLRLDTDSDRSTSKRSKGSTQE